MDEDDETVGRSRRKRKTAVPPPQPQPQQRRSEVQISLAHGALIRARYDGPGGGSLNIYCGEHIALHVNPRPYEGLVLNSHFGGWGPEERPDGFPFEPGADIVLSVRLRAGCFVITARAAGADEFEYEYRFRHPAGAQLTHFAVDIPGLRGLAVQPGA